MVIKEQYEAISLLEQKLVNSKQTKTGKEDEGERGIGGILASVINTVEDAIRETEGEYKETKSKIIDDKLRGVKIQADHFKELAESSRGYKKREQEALEKITKMQAGRLRLAFDIKPEEEVKFEKFKKWVKESGFALSGILIGIGGIIAVVATTLRTGVQVVARGSYGLGKGIAKILSKLGALFSALGSIIMSILGAALQALMWLSNNLWVLLVFLVMFVWRRLGNAHAKL